MNKIFALMAATSSPTEDPATQFYSPGTLGFIFTFIMVAGAVILIFDMVKRVRRVRYRAEIQERLEAEAAEGKTATPTETPAMDAGPAASKPAAKKKPERPAPPTKPQR